MPLDQLGSLASETPRTEKRRGDDTRGRLLDAVEGLIADHGFKPLTHRTIASRAEAHVALLNYHFGSKEQLIEEALARRAGQLLALQHEALAALRERGDFGVEDVLWAYARPFASLDQDMQSAWRNYLCLVARLAGHDPTDGIMLRHFGSDLFPPGHRRPRIAITFSRSAGLVQNCAQASINTRRFSKRSPRR